MTDKTDKPKTVKCKVLVDNHRHHNRLCRPNDVIELTPGTAKRLADRKIVEPQK